jgi:hypothetical protein
VTKFLLLVNYDGGLPGTPMPSWGPADIKANLAYYDALNQELTTSGEPVQAHILEAPEAAKVVRSDGRGAPLVTDGPFAETKEVLAGYEMVDVGSLERAIEIAARLSAVPGRGGAPTQQPIEVRQVVGDQAPPINDRASAGPTTRS